MFKIMHICNNYISSKVHLELIRALSLKNDIEQSVFVPVRIKSDIGKLFIKKQNIKISYFNYRFSLLKYFPLIKVFIVFLGFLFSKDRQKPNIIIAHNFWSDGMIAFLNYIIYKTPYILVVRNTDMNVFLPRLKHYHWLMSVMVEKSNGLIFVNKIYKDSFEKKYPKIYIKSNNNTIIFNGVNQFWLCEKDFHGSYKRDDTLIFVGTFNKNKNLEAVIKASEKLLIKRPNLKLIVVGGDEKEFKKLLNISVIPNFVQVMGKILDKDKLRTLYRQSKIFIMPSFFETFGLVYIEALLQGCAVIHSKGQGIDGIFEQDFILSVDPDNVNDIANKIEYLFQEFCIENTDSEFNLYLRELFDWNNIADQYLRTLQK